MKYFKNISDFEELKKQYKQNALKLHPDKGGDAEEFKEMQNEFDTLFIIWSKSHKVDMKECEREFSEFYTQNGWKGSNYRSSYSTRDVAERLKAYARTYLNDFKITVKTDYFSGGSSITVTVREIPEELVVDKEAYAEAFAKDKPNWNYREYSFEELKEHVMKSIDEGKWFDDQNSYRCFFFNHEGKVYEGLNKYVVETCKDMYEMVQSYRRDDCDGQIDYFDVNFWEHFHFGSWDKGVKVVPKKRKSVFVSTEVKQEKSSNYTTPQSKKSGNEDLEVPSDVKIVDYSEKAIAIIGDTKPIKELLKALGCRFNPYLSCGVGWIASKKREAEIRKALKI